MPRIAVVGSANMDLTVRCAALPRAGETLIGQDFATSPGGKGANQAVAAGRLARGGTEVFFVGCVGRDPHGEELKQGLSEAGVDTEFLCRTSVAPTGTALITVDSQGENTIVVVPGANALLDPAHVRRALDALKPEVVLVQLEVPDLSVEACAGAPTLVLDPAPARHLDAEFWTHVAFVTPNESETLALTGIAPLGELALRRASHVLLGKGARAVVIKLGPQGVFYTDGSSETIVPAPAVKAVDTTAAGDAFNGALAVALVEGRPVASALEWAVRCASLSTTRHGAQPALLTRDEVERWPGP
jgi:ribokinase